MLTSEHCLAQTTGASSPSESYRPKYRYTAYPYSSCLCSLYFDLPAIRAASEHCSQKVIGEYRYTAYTAYYTVYSGYTTYTLYIATHPLRAFGRIPKSL